MSDRQISLRLDELQAILENLHHDDPRLGDMLTEYYDLCTEQHLRHRANWAIRN